MRKYYRNCEELPIYNFYKVLDKKDFSYLVVDYNAYDKIEPNEELISLWENIYEEYLRLSKNNTMLLYYETVSELLYLESRYEVAMTLLQQISMGRMDKNMLNAYVLELNKWNYILDIKKPLKDELNRLTMQLKQSENKIRLKQSIKKELEDGNKEIPMTLVEQQVKLEQSLSRNEIDTKKTSVLKWIQLIKEVKFINEERIKNNGK